MAIDLLQDGEQDELKDGDELDTEGFDLLSEDDEDADTDGEEDEESNEEGDEDAGNEEDEKPAESEKPVAASKSEAREMQRRLDRLEADLREARASERYWAEQAKAAPRPDAKPVAKKEPELSVPPEQFLAELNADPMGALKRHGFVTRAEAAQITEEREAELLEKAKEIAAAIVKSERDALTSDAQVLRRFKDLSDENSEMSKLTGQRAQELIKRGMPANLVLEVAAEWAEAKLEAKRQAAAPKDRLKLINRQAAPAGGRASSRAGDDEDMTPLLRRLTKEWGLDEKGVRQQQSIIRRRGA